MGQINSRVGVDVWVVTVVLLLVTSAVAGLGMRNLLFSSGPRGRTRVPVSSLVVNPVFWVNVLYQVTVVVVVFRLVALELMLFGRKFAARGALGCSRWLVRSPKLSPTHSIRCFSCGVRVGGRAALFFPILFNWAGSLITWIASITPLRLIQHSGVMFDADGTEHVILLPSIGSKRGNVVMLTTVAAVSIVSALVTLSVCLASDLAEECLLAWRIVFICSAVLEMACLLRCVVIFRESTDRLNYRNYCQATLFQRGAICVTICLRLIDVIPSKFALSVFHMLVILVGILWFNWRAVQKLTASLKGSSSVVPASEKSSKVSTKVSTALDKHDAALVVPSSG
jgi:hypothetical protein